VTALLSLGLRPFYLLGAAAALTVPLWALVYLHGRPLGPVDLAWHAHEMVFGFAPAVIAGFLLTAAANWTGRTTATGGALAALAGLWLAGRVGIATGTAAGAVVAAAFLPALAIVIARPILASRNQRNYGVVAVLATLATFDATYLLAGFGAIDGVWQRAAAQGALGVVALLVAFIGGRVIPAFTANAVPDARPRRILALDAAALGGLALLAALDVASAAGWSWPGLVPALCAVLALLHALRLALFEPWKTRHNRLLVALPLGYLWIVVYLAMRASGSSLLATHALTVGAIAGMMIAMMTRSALGHTGRALTAGPFETTALLLVHVAALVRVVGPAIDAGAYAIWIGVSSVLFAAAFVTFLVRYVPILFRARVDAGAG